MKKNEPCYVWHLDKRVGTLQLLRITLNERTTKLDFGYQSSPEYDDGWWINIFPQTHLLSNLSTRKFFMQDQVNMVMAPNKMDLVARTDCHFFSLNFAPLPMDNQVISMIEAEVPDKDNFNFMDIELQMSEAINVKLI